MLKITIKNGSIAEERCDAIINPTNSYGIMNSSVSKALKNFGGIMIEVEAMRKSPIKIGEAIETEPGMLSCKYIIHSPTMVQPLSKTSEDEIRKSVIAALKKSESLRCEKIAMPGMGTGIGNFEPIDAAKIIINEIRKFKSIYLKEVILIDISEIMVNAFKDELEN